jgi:hypothetical protein
MVRGATPSPIIAIAAQGVDSYDGSRLRALLGSLPFDELAVDRTAKRRTAFRLVRALRTRRPKLVVMEGTGLSVGSALLIARFLWGTPYVVSSGDAVGPYFRAKGGAVAGLVGGIYERVLYGNAEGVIGWTPYIAGRALTFGAPRAVTAENWTSFTPAPPEGSVRAELGISSNAVVYGIVGNMNWNRKAGYAYGLELVRARLASTNVDVVVLLVGDGSGRAAIEEAAGSALGRSVISVGRVPRDEVPRYLAAMDYGSLPQSRDGVGAFRFTTKLSEYITASVPMVTTRIPAAYDVAFSCVTRLAGRTPWSDEYVRALSDHMDRATAASAARDRQRMSGAEVPGFDRASQVVRVGAFLSELLEELVTNESLKV